ncbi:MAG TPA: bifunctional phosphoribosylaminoimidazolecarboxamide formyltransferase/IMP cyclohydrolase, partial [Candidatus Polarisedimenticolia bacterium]|nr:bifunctional phosphoribosylaminoimidazolecarboxamide formyltransferase/IMP cyclohydrolase [Candidatus Polarisedimenticolia bacterium]
MNELAIRRALISVSDKSGLVEFARFLKERGVEILSTGGSAKALGEAGIVVTEVSAHTGFPEIMDGRVKTLHPLIHGGILARRDSEEHLAAASAHGIALIDLVVVNLYPFEAALAGGADEARLVENIDVGGPAMIRAAAKNFDFVAVVTSPGDYKAVQEEMAAKDGALSRATRRRLSASAFARTSAYDAAIAGWMNKDTPLASRLILAGELKQSLRYGENPHQEAAFYKAGEARPGVATARQIQGKELSYNNLNDTDAAYELVAEFSEPAVVIVKHANPCGVAIADDLATAYRRALACDPISAFGGIVAVNRSLDAATAALIGELFAEVVIAPDFAPAALDLLSAKKNLRLLAAGLLPDPAAPGLSIKTLAGGFLAQSRDNGRVAREHLTLASKRAPSESEMADMLFAFTVAKHVKSNAIVYAKNLATVGIGAGQMSRVDSSRIAAWKAKEAAQAAGEVE